MAIQFGVNGDLRFISHHDTLRLFARALARADVPVRYSEGFNPQPRMRIVLPRPVGVESLDELLVVELACWQSPLEVLGRLRTEMPRDITLRDAEALAEDDDRVPISATYSLDIEASLQESVARSAAQFLERPSVTVSRPESKSKAGKLVDVRAFVSMIEVDANRVSWTQTITHQGTARPGEVIEQLGLSAGDHLHRLCRTKVSYQQPNAEPSAASDRIAEIPAKPREDQGDQTGQTPKEEAGP